MCRGGSALMECAPLQAEAADGPFEAMGQRNIPSSAGATRAVPAPGSAVRIRPLGVTFGDSRRRANPRRDTPAVVLLDHVVVHEDAPAHVLRVRLEHRPPA